MQQIIARTVLGVSLLIAWPALSQDYNGSWCGTTAQGWPIYFRVENNQVVFARVSFVIGSGSSCPVGSSQSMFAPVVGGRATFGSGSGSLDPLIWNVAANFSTTMEAAGTLAVTLQTVPGAPFQCTGVIVNPTVINWTATKSAVPFSISPAALTFGSNGGPGRIAVNIGESCSWQTSETLSWVNVLGSSGTGEGAARFTVLPNTTGASRSGTITINGVPATITQTTTPEVRQLPVAGSAAGNLGSFFRTAVQIYNATTTSMAGRFVLRSAGRPGSDADPTLQYSLAADQSIVYPDLLPAMSQAGLGSIDVVATSGGFPTMVARIFNDGGAAGTAGMTADLLRPEEALGQGSEGVLIAPPDRRTARFNIGVRTLGSGAVLSITHRSADGNVKSTRTASYSPHFFEQVAAAAFAGSEIHDSDSITIRVDSGSAIIYGAATDNLTQDPSMQVARAISRADTGGETRYLTVAGSAAGNLGSFFRTAVQIHNPTLSPMSGRLIFHPQGSSGSDADPSMPYAVAPGQTISYSDLLPAMGTSGLGSVDVVSTAGAFPVLVARVFNDGGPAGTTGLSQELIASGAVLRKDTNTALLTPADLTNARFNIGIRTLASGASMNLNIVDRAGRSLKRFSKTFPPNFFQQSSAASFIEGDVPEAGAVWMFISGGSAIIYGATTDNRTQDPSVQFARSVAR